MRERCSLCKKLKTNFSYIKDRVIICKSCHKKTIDTQGMCDVIKYEDLKISAAIQTGCITANGTKPL